MSDIYETTLNPFGSLDLAGSRISSSDQSAIQRAQDIRLQQVIAGSDYRNRFSMMEPPSNDNPFNSRLYDNKITAETSLRVTPKVATIWDNRHHTNTDIALYDTRNIGYHAEELIGPNKIQDALMARARSRIETPESYMMDDYYRGTGYNPRLPISPTNKPPANKPPLILDERILQHGAERPYTYEGDQVINSINMLKSPDRIDRLKRQKEADDALLHHKYVPRAYQPQNAYLRQTHNPTLDIDDVIYQISSGDNRQGQLLQRHAPDRIQQLDYYPAKESFVSDTSVEDKPKGILNTITSFFSFNSTKGAREHQVRDIRSELAPTIRFEQTDLPTEDGIRQIQERFVTKPQHMLVIRDNKGITQEFPDEFDVSSYMAITKDPIQLLPTRTIAMIHNDQFWIIQQKANTAIFAGDSRPVGDDLIATSVPMQLLESSFRNSIKHRIRDDTDTVKLTFEEFKDISNFVDSHPELQKRLPITDLPDKKARNILSDERIEEALVESFNVYPGAPTKELEPGSQYRAQFAPTKYVPERSKGVGRKFDDPL